MTESRTCAQRRGQGGLRSGLPLDYHDRAILERFEHVSQVQILPLPAIGQIEKRIIRELTLTS